MNLLVITQKIDKNDGVLGFFHRWCEKLAERCSTLHVICLQQGDHCLPDNVTVWSLGKESGSSRLKYVLRFYRRLWALRGQYDCVLVHMNPVYIILGGLLWKAGGRPYYQWYNHQQGGLTAAIAVKTASAAFYTSPHSFTARFRNSRPMPAGIDTRRFCKDGGEPRHPNSILYVGRISPIKKVHVLIEAARILDARGLDFNLRLAGGAGDHDRPYLEQVREAARGLAQKGKVLFLGEIPNDQTAALYSKTEVLVNLSPPGLFDKTILEAMACEALVLVSSRAFENVLPAQFIFRENSAGDLAGKLAAAFSLSAGDKAGHGKVFRRYVLENHDLDSLVDALIQTMRT